jgi:hypothetical protein
MKREIITLIRNENKNVIMSKPDDMNIEDVVEILQNVIHDLLIEKFSDED